MKRALFIAVMTLILAACGGTSPEPDYYTLMAVPGASSDVNVSVEIERPALPDYLDRPGIVRQNGDRVTIDDLHRWAAPLDTMFENFLAADLRQRMPASYIIGERDTALAKTRFIVETDIEAFNQTDEGALLTAQINITDRDDCGYAHPQSTPFRATSTQSDEAAGLSELLGDAADRISSLLQQKKTAAICCQSSLSAICANP